GPLRSSLSRSRFTDELRTPVGTEFLPDICMTPSPSYDRVISHAEQYGRSMGLLIKEGEK
ncbi:MAG: hypothetical protein ACXW39_05630, partial [Nitrospira sp.]